ncbi:MAG: iron-sulfur cluster assembly scaffold protein, partial [Dehalococcoidia bacterium]
SELDRLQDDLQKMILADARETYSEIVIKHAMNPKNVGDMPDADGYGHSLGSCGDDIEIWLKVTDGKVVKATFWTDGCLTSTACGSMATELVTGRTVAKARCTSQKEILDALGDLPEESRHCATLAASAVKEAVRNYLDLQREPWKKLYPRQKS